MIVRSPVVEAVVVLEPPATIAAAADVLVAVESGPLEARGGMCEGESNPTFSCFFKSLASLAICRRVAKVMLDLLFCMNAYGDDFLLT